MAERDGYQSPSELPSGLGSALDSLLSDPQALSRMMSLVSGMMGQSGGAPSERPSAPERSDGADGAIAVSSGFSERSGIEYAGDRNGSGYSGGSDRLGGLPELSSLTGLAGGLGGSDHRCELLRALKPYLRHGRAERIELMIRALTLSQIARNTLFKR